MPYSSDGINFVYTASYLQYVAINYEAYAEGEAGSGKQDTKIDFDNAVNGLGGGTRTCWSGNCTEDLKRFNNAQKLVVAEVYGIRNSELWRKWSSWIKGFDITTERKRVYNQMAEYLNTGVGC